MSLSPVLKPDQDEAAETSVQQQHESTWNVEEPFLDEHIADLAAGRLAAAIKGFGRIQTETLSNFSKYRQILEDGPERGLTVWQVMNPFYYIWSTLPIVGQKVSERWKETGFNNSVDAEALVRSPLSKNEKLVAAIVRAKCKDIDWSSARVLECGTGNGANAALFLGEVGVAPSNYFGFDLHPSRVESTRSVIRLVATGDTDSEGLEKRIFELDILADTAADTLRKLASIDVLFSASFTNVFDDSQISKVLDHISVLAPKYIVDVSVITSWALCFGRHDLSDHYDSIGYQLSGSQFETPVISGDEGYRIWLPEKASANRNILVYERARF
jgi:hypothetical protein